MHLFQSIIDDIDSNPGDTYGNHCQQAIFLDLPQIVKFRAQLCTTQTELVQTICTNSFFNHWWLV